MDNLFSIVSQGSIQQIINSKVHMNRMNQLYDGGRLLNWPEFPAGNLTPTTVHCQQANDGYITTGTSKRQQEVESFHYMDGPPLRGAVWKGKGKKI
jgi:hypothetical protein